MVNDMNDIKGRPVVIKEQDIEQELDVLNGIGLDEYFCPFYVSTSTVRPIYVTLVIVAVGFLLCIGYDLLTKGRQGPRKRRDNRSSGESRRNHSNDKGRRFRP